jgi:hypothetical protein
MPLKEGEKLQSLSGVWAGFCRDIYKKYVESKGGLYELINWEIGRGAGFQAVATAVHGEINFLLQLILTNRS